MYYVQHPETKMTLMSERSGTFYIFGRPIGWKELSERGFERIEGLEWLELAFEEGSLDNVAKLFVDLAFRCPITGIQASIQKRKRTLPKIHDINGFNFTSKENPLLCEYDVSYVDEEGRVSTESLTLESIFNMQAQNGKMPAGYIFNLHKRFGSLTGIFQNLEMDKLLYLFDIVEGLPITDVFSQEYYRREFMKCGYDDEISWIGRNRLSIMVPEIAKVDNLYVVTLADGTEVPVTIKLLHVHDPEVGPKVHGSIEFSNGEVQEGAIVEFELNEPLTQRIVIDTMLSKLEFPEIVKLEKVDA